MNPPHLAIQTVPTTTFCRDKRGAREPGEERSPERGPAGCDCRKGGRSRRPQVSVLSSSNQRDGGAGGKGRGITKHRNPQSG